MWNNCVIQKIDYNTARNFARKAKNLIFKEEYIYYAICDDTGLNSIAGIAVNNDKIKLHCNYTPLEKRGQGYFTNLLLWIIKEYQNKDLMADCLEDSKGIYLKCGFDLIQVKHYKNFDIYKVKKARGNNE